LANGKIGIQIQKLDKIGEFLESNPKTFIFPPLFGMKSQNFTYLCGTNNKFKQS